ncbi:hypothetical protein SISSUDRAFT_1042324 [Sistotremastrum suecicum HHB10207 ss-3]|uniref:Pali-domain-containing protein n=1 Tax=Sistotremastrum suecicum HHB10207 ss-3 TaxID=1314776 RepID=A0A166GLU8_9AGAM|nr:hypothetical protein SISSUDRAFT_1042324 [Sistotremastrum suecicum HHB10207 ss-3]
MPINPIPPAFLLTFAAFVLLILCTFSVPLVSTFYFLHADIAGGVKFGGWGWCLDNQGPCSGSAHVGYSWDPDIIVWLTKVMIFYPIATAFTFLAAASLLPLLCTGRPKMFPSPIYSILALISFITTFVAYIFTIALFVTAQHRFKRDGFHATYGPLFWMALVATIILFLMTLNSGCGSVFRGRFGRASPYIAYNV